LQLARPLDSTVTAKVSGLGLSESEKALEPMNIDEFGSMRPPAPGRFSMREILSEDRPQPLGEDAGQHSGVLPCGLFDLSQN
jgi:hypothetical protein